MQPPPKKTNAAAMPPKVPYRSLMASLTLAQRQRFARVANGADDRRFIREQRLAPRNKQTPTKEHKRASLVQNIASYINRLFS